MPAEVSSFASFTEVYIDGPGPESILGNPVVIETNDSISAQEIDGEIIINATS